MKRISPRKRMAFIAVVCIAMQCAGHLLWSVAALLIWLTAMLFYDRPGLRRLHKPRFWLITMTFALLSGMLLGERDVVWLGVRWSWQGLQAGALMVVRGAFLFGIAVWASRAMRPAKIHRAFGRIGLSELGGALISAMNLLPHMESVLSTLQLQMAMVPRWRMPWIIMKGLIRETAVVAQNNGECIKNQGGEALRVAVVGPPQSGKTRAVHRILEELRSYGQEVGGITQPPIDDPEGRQGYLLRDEGTGETRPFAIRIPKTSPNEPRYRLDEAGYAWASRRILHGRRHCDVLVVDELGRLEGQGEGHMGALLIPVSQERPWLRLLSVRQDRQDQISRWLGGFHHVWTLPLSDDELGERIKTLVKEART